MSGNFYRYVNNQNINPNLSSNVPLGDLTIEKSDRPFTPDTFRLRNNEDYVSLLMSDGEQTLDRVRLCLQWLSQKRNRSFPHTYGFVEFDKDNLMENINEENKLIDIVVPNDHDRDECTGVKHCELYYFPNDDFKMDLILTLISEVLREQFILLKKVGSKNDVTGAEVVLPQNLAGTNISLVNEEGGLSASQRFEGV